MGVRRQAREAVLQALFMCDFLDQWNEESIQLCFTHFSVPKAALIYARKLADGVLNNIVEVDSYITRASEHWSISRMGRVDRGILRLATYEIVLKDDIPINVAINEAIEIAKRFGAEESPTFINGVLDRIASNKTRAAKKAEAEEAAEEAAEKLITERLVAAG